MANLEMPEDQWRELTVAYHEALNKAPIVRINHPAAGSVRPFPTLQELRDRIAELAQQGFHAPAGLLEKLDEEIREDHGHTRQEDSP